MTESPEEVVHASLNTGRSTWAMCGQLLSSLGLSSSLLCFTSFVLSHTRFIPLCPYKLPPPLPPAHYASAFFIFRGHDEERLLCSSQQHLWGNIDGAFQDNNLQHSWNLTCKKVKTPSSVVCWSDPRQDMVAVVAVLHLITVEGWPPTVLFVIFISHCPAKSINCCKLCCAAGEKIIGGEKNPTKQWMTFPTAVCVCHNSNPSPFLPGNATSPLTRLLYDYHWKRRNHPPSNQSCWEVSMQ